MEYIAFLHHDESTKTKGSSSYGVSFPDLPGCFSGGETEEEAKARAGRALTLHIEELQALGLPVPAPSRLADALAKMDGVGKPFAVSYKEDQK